MAVNQARPGRNPLPDGAAAPLWSRFSKAMLAFQFVQREFPTGFSARETMNQFPLIGFGFRFSRSETTIPDPIHRFAPGGSNRSQHQETGHFDIRLLHNRLHPAMSAGFQLLLPQQAVSHGILFRAWPWFAPVACVFLRARHLDRAFAP